MRFMQNHKDNYGGSCKPQNSTSQGSAYWVVSSPPVENLLIHPPPLPDEKLPSPHTKQQFSSYNPIKTALFAVGIAPAPLF